MTLRGDVHAELVMRKGQTKSSAGGPRSWTTGLWRGGASRISCALLQPPNLNGKIGIIYGTAQRVPYKGDS